MDEELRRVLRKLLLRRGRRELSEMERLRLRNLQRAVMREPPEAERMMMLHDVLEGHEYVLVPTGALTAQMGFLSYLAQQLAQAGVDGAEGLPRPSVLFLRDVLMDTMLAFANDVVAANQGVEGLFEDDV